MKPQNFEEKVVWYAIIGTYVLYFLGALHIVAPAIAWFLGFYTFKKLWSQTATTPAEERITVPVTVWVWLVAMLMIQLALVIGHLDFDMGDRVIKSTFNFFARSWAMFALFPLIGCLKIRPQLVYRAVCILCLQCLFFVVIGIGASIVHLPTPLYISPLYKLGGIGDAYYRVQLYEIDPETGGLRLDLFTPWAPALGLVGNIFFWISLQESNLKWRWIGIISSVAMVLSSVSRLGFLCLLIVPCTTWFLLNCFRPGVQLIGGAASFLGGLFGFQLLNLLRDFKDQFDSQRPGSSQVRATLARMSIDRWWNEAPIWGHGILDPRGPELVTYKPIGSHHLWFGLLFSHGIVGFLAVAIAMLWSFFDLLLKSFQSQIARTGLCILLVLFLFSFAENLEATIYVYWPGLVMLGIALKQKVSLPWLESAPLLQESSSCSNAV